ncbi:hypothetical protein SORBI_3005G089400 [Sorghum bicolor]|uniref:Uncharacterized protein n=1 Tax=Sorghum bicolor TaxID=4558 RepID=A0A1Z5RHH8_SORBI|nr:hypothetical protein SORBI_3005G089400 [Sorghum bicolor]OQU83185.1 hypothetical protein SORBI_3005G089400 [Sorghum bicolor]
MSCLNLSLSIGRAECLSSFGVHLAYMLQQVTLKQSWAPRTSEVDLFGLHSQLTAISILFTAAGEPGII